MKVFRKIFCFILATVILLNVYTVISFAENENLSAPADSARGTENANEKKSLSEIYMEPYGKTLCAARKGYWRNSAENSLESIRDAVKAGADIIEADIKKTADGVLILMEDDNIKRTCGEDRLVSESTFDELSKYTLLSGEGGSNAEKTDLKIPSLKQVFKNRESCLYLLDADWSLRDDIYALAEKYDMLDSVIFLTGNIKASEIKEWKMQLEKEPMTMTYFKGNIIFGATAYVNGSAEAGAESVYLASKVPSGVVFGKTVFGKAEGKIRMAANTAVSELCGTIREDTEVWWDDLISRGYSIIITDYVPELKSYISDCEEKRDDLSAEYQKLVTNWRLPDLKSDKYLDYKLAYNNAAAFAESLLFDKSSSKSDLSTAVYELQKAYDDINNNYESLKNGTAGMTVTPLRILLCVIAAAAVCAAEVFVYKKKKKR